MRWSNPLSLPSGQCSLRSTDADTEVWVLNGPSGMTQGALETQRLSLMCCSDSGLRPSLQERLLLKLGIFHC